MPLRCIISKSYELIFFSFKFCFDVINTFETFIKLTRKHYYFIRILMRLLGHWGALRKEIQAISTLLNDQNDFYVS